MYIFINACLGDIHIMNCLSINDIKTMAAIYIYMYKNSKIWNKVLYYV